MHHPDARERATLYGQVHGGAEAPEFRPCDEAGATLLRLRYGCARLALPRSAAERLARQGWSERDDPEPVCLLRIRLDPDLPSFSSIEYVDPHHNID